MWGQGGKEGGEKGPELMGGGNCGVRMDRKGVSRDQSCWESRTAGSPANGADGMEKSGAMGGKKSGAGGRGAACGAMGGVGVAHRLCILPLSLALGGCSSGTPSGDGASLCALRCCSRLYSRSSASSVPARAGGGGAGGRRQGCPPSWGSGLWGEKGGGLTHRSGGTGWPPAAGRR